MRGAGVRELGAPVELIDLAEPRSLLYDEVLVTVKAAGVGNWDEIVRTGGWDVGTQPPMALGVEFAGVVAEVDRVDGEFSVGDEVLAHVAPLPFDGAWAEQVIAPVGSVAHKPQSVSWSVAGAFPIPALTAEQVLSEVLQVTADDTILVYGAGGVTGGLIVQLAAARGCDVVATASPRSADRVRGFGAREVLNYTDPRWPANLRELTMGRGATVGVNAARHGAASVLPAVADGGRLATITGDPPGQERGISVSDVYVRPDAQQLAGLVRRLADDELHLAVAGISTLSDAGAALSRAASGESVGAWVISLES